MFYQIYLIRYAQLNLFPTIHFLDLRVVSTSETESIVKQRFREMWQRNRGEERMGWMYYGVQRKWEKWEKHGMNRWEETIISRLRCRHSAFNYTVLKRWKQDIRNWDSCGQIETMEDVISHCQKYEAYRQNLTTYLRKTKVPLGIMVILKQNSGCKC